MVLGGLLVAIAIGLLLLALGRPGKGQIVVYPPSPVDSALVAGAAQATAIVTPLPTFVATPAPTATPASVTVFVSGAVARPGVYQLPGGARVVDALAAAGGALPTAAQDGVNLAILLRDEAQIYVPLQRDALPLPTAGMESATRGLVLSPNALAGPPVNLNSASAAELETLPGIGPAKAQMIIANRPFASVEDLERVPGVGPATMEQLRPLVTAP
jgi:competence protein ComEA